MTAQPLARAEVLQSTAQKTAAPGEAAFSNDNASRRPHARSGWRPSESATVLLAAPGLAVIAAEVAGNAALVRANGGHTPWCIYAPASGDSRPAGVPCTAGLTAAAGLWRDVEIASKDERRLVDARQGSALSPKGYLHERGRSVPIKLDDGAPVRAAILHVQP